MVSYISFSPLFHNMSTLLPKSEFVGTNSPFLLSYSTKYENFIVHQDKSSFSDQLFSSRNLNVRVSVMF